MKKTTRLTLIALLAMLVLVCGTVLVACGGNAEEAINAYMLNKDLVEDDFVLPKYIGELNKKGVGTVKVNWTSNNDAIEIVERDEDFLAKVNQKDTTTKVKLTISDKKHEKSFELIVSRFDVYTLSANYVFVNKGLVVSDDFELDTTYTLKGHTGTISWSVEGTSADYLKVVEKDGKTICEVDVPGSDTDVEIKATFKYNGQENSVTYAFQVGEEKSHLNYVDTIYSVENTGLSFSGYVVAIHEIGTSFGNATFYAVDDDFCSGYYFYRIKMVASDLEKLKVGVHVTVTGATTKNYNGLWENNNNGNAVVDDNPEDLAATINPRDHVYALDNDIISGSPATLYRESSFVSLTGWTVSKKPSSAPKTTDNATLFYLKKGDSAEIAVSASKYMGGHYTLGDETHMAIYDYYNSLNVGDVVNVTGILGYYNGFQIQPLSPDDITKGTADPAGTTYLGTAVKSALEAVSNAITAANISGTLSAEHTFTMPTSSNGVTISYKVCGSSKAVKIAEEANGAKFTVTPGAKLDARKIQVTYTNGTYTTYTFFKISSQARNDQETVDAVKDNLDNTVRKDFVDNGFVDLPTALEGATITWAITEGDGSWVTLTGSNLTVVPDTAAHTVKLTATIKFGGITDTKDITLSLTAKPVENADFANGAVAGNYVFALYQANSKKWLYMKGEKSGNYIASTEESSEAATVVVAGSEEDGWTLSVGGKYIEPNTSGSISQTTLTETSVEKWHWNSELGVFTCTISTGSNEGKIVYLGTFGTNTTFSCSETYRISGANASVVGVDQFVARLYKVPQA